MKDHLEKAEIEEEAFKDGQFLGIITGGVIFAVAFLIFSVM